MTPINREPYKKYPGYFSDEVLYPTLPTPEREKLPPWPVHNEKINKFLVANFNPLLAPWFQQLEGSVKDGVVILKSMNKFNSNWIRDHYGQDIKRIFEPKEVKYIFKQEA